MPLYDEALFAKLAVSEHGMSFSGQVGKLSTISQLSETSLGTTCSPLSSCRPCFVLMAAARSDINLPAHGVGGYLMRSAKEARRTREHDALAPERSGSSARRAHATPETRRRQVVRGPQAGRWCE